MMRPRQMIASNRADSAATRAACGISNAPGTDRTWTFASAAPASSSAATAAARKLPVTVSLKRDTITANRNADASASGAGGSSGPRTVSVPSPTFVGDGTLLPLEFGFALLEEGLRALAHVVGADHEAEQRRLEGLRLGERHVQAPVHRLQDVADRDGRLGRERRGQLLRLRHQLR